MRRPLFVVQYAQSDDPDLWMNLEQIRKLLPSTPWRHSRVYEDATIAADMGMPLSHFWLWSEMDRAYAIARRRVASAIAAYDALLHEKEMKRQQRQSRSRRGK